MVLPKPPGPWCSLALLFGVCSAIPAGATDQNSLDLATYRLTGESIPAAPTVTIPPQSQSRPAPGAAASRLASMPFAKLIEGAAREASLDPALVHAVIAVESGYNPTARSPKGALGLMQVLPATALRFGITNAERSPKDNLRAGTRYLSLLMNMFDHRLDLVLAAYNAGEGAVMRYGQRIPPFRETQQYVPAVLARYREWREVAPVTLHHVAATPAERIRVNYMPGTMLESTVLRAQGYR